MSAYEPKSDAEAALRAHGLAYPLTHEDFPWGHRALKVKGKAFAFIGWDGGRFSMSAKLPQSHVRALDLPYAESTGYGLGKSGWVTARFEEGERVPVDVLKQWLDESWRAIAPKSALEALDSGSRAPVQARPAARVPSKRSPERAGKPAAKRASTRKPSAPKRSSKPARKAVAKAKSVRRAR